MGGGATGRDWDPGREADLFVQMGFMSALKEAQEIAAGKRKRAFLVLVHNMRCLNQQSHIHWELVGHTETQPHHKPGEPDHVF